MIQVRLDYLMGPDAQWLREARYPHLGRWRLEGRLAPEDPEHLNTHTMRHRHVQIDCFYALSLIIHQNNFTTL